MEESSSVEEDEIEVGEDPKDESTGLAARKLQRHRRDIYLAKKRMICRGSFNKLVKRYHTALTEQRRHFEEGYPDDATIQAATLQPPSGKAKQDAERVLEDAYADLDAEAARLKSVLERVRRAEIVLHPEYSITPTVLALAVSAPCKSWALESFTVPGTPLPRVVEMLTSLFAAGYSSSIPQNNKRRKTWQLTMKDGQLDKKPHVGTT
jgi:hypothetical protein